MGQGYGQHPRGKATPPPGSRTPPPPPAGRVRFFVVGDIVQAGPRRAAVADAMAQLQSAWAADGEATAAFVICTGDQIYGEPTAASFDLLAQEMMDKVPLPWIPCLGNHDVGGNNAGWHWHRGRNGLRGAAGWRWLCPAPAFALDDVCPGLAGPVDLVVINTNKLRTVSRLTAPARGHYLAADGSPARPFYQSTEHGQWWRDQKLALEHHFQAAGPRAAVGGRWRIIVGHHPCEFADDAGISAYTEHRLPIAKYFATTYMRGGPKASKCRWGLAHVLRREADLYICGHQHLMAHLVLALKERRPADERDCEFTIVGSSSKTEQDEGDFEDDFAIAKHLQPRPAQLDRECSVSNVSDGARKRYASPWSCKHVGFAVVDASAESGAQGLSITFYRASGDDSADCARRCKRFKVTKVAVHHASINPLAVYAAAPPPTATTTSSEAGLTESMGTESTSWHTADMGSTGGSIGGSIGGRKRESSSEALVADVEGQSSHVEDVDDSRG
eukprot:NODE_5367_length_1778_cov_5.918837.p1 GENE.NODE_5367_length_1778_cov_5.918837~~NODE_5367_length_1778_cov_5.918837.p1  ORF type:complete len:520 (-),score=133.58 NODE_5367_length_1778_cov_5.918837:218-1723(-)